MNYLKTSAVVLLCAFITSCGDEQVNKEAPVEKVPKAEVQATTPPQPAPKTEVEVKMNTPMGEVKVKTEK